MSFEDFEKIAVEPMDKVPNVIGSIAPSVKKSPKKAKATQKSATETRSQKVIIYVTPSDKDALIKHLGRKSESSELYPIIKKYIDLLTH